jgi:hypothetical protein
MAKGTTFWEFSIGLGSYHYTTFGSTELEAKQTMVKLLNQYRDERYTLKKVEALTDYYGGYCTQVELGKGYRR